MIDTSKKSRQEILREKKEAELRELRKKESEWKRKQENGAKCMIGAAFLKCFPEALLFEAEEWDRIARAAVMSKEFQGMVQAIKQEASDVKKPGSEPVVPETAKGDAGEKKPAQEMMKPETVKEAVSLRKPVMTNAQPKGDSDDFFDEEDGDTDPKD